MLHVESDCGHFAGREHGETLRKKNAGHILWEKRPGPGDLRSDNDVCRCRILSGPIYEQNVKYLIKKRGLDIFSKNPYNSKIFGFKNQKFSKYSDFLKKSQQKKTAIWIFLH